MSKSRSISIVIPVYNGARTIAELCNQIVKDLRDKDLFEIILVDDGSRDDSWKVIERLKDQLGGRLVGVKLNRNVGQHNAIMCGLSISKGDLVVTMDDDLRHQPNDIEALISCQVEKSAKLVYGVEEVYAGNRLRSSASALVKKSTKHFSDHGFQGGSSFRLMTRGLVEKLKTNRGRTIYIDEIVHWHTTAIAMCPVSNKVVQSKSRYSVLRLFSLYGQIVHDYASWPLKTMIYIGGASSLITFLLAVRFIIRRFAYEIEVPGFTATIVAILFSTSLILWCLGVIGLYIFKLYQMQSGRPSYTVRKVI